MPSGVRPLSDRAREGLFSSLAAEIPGARVLDLYAGTGALGIEALSRGAEHAVFVDRSRHAIAAIEENLALTELAERATVVASDVSAFLSGEPGAGPFDLTLLDPPYDVSVAELEGVLRDLATAWLVDRDWTVALTRGSRSSMPVIPVDWTPARQLQYGDSLVIAYREVSWA